MSLQEQLATGAQGNVVIVGIGNPCRGDDAAGSLVARRIRDAPGVRVIDAQDVPEDYLRVVVNQQPDTVVLIDAVDLGSAPGSVALLHKDQMAGNWPSTHRMPLCLLMNYLEQETNACIFLIAIQPRQTGFLEPVSEEVSRSVARVAEVLNCVLEMPRMCAGGVFSNPSRRKVAA
jgi:hydrogenase 3 maturation protease